MWRNEGLNDNRFETLSLKIRNSNNSYINEIQWVMSVFEHFLFFTTVTWKLINIIDKLYNNNNNIRLIK